MSELVAFQFIQPSSTFLVPGHLVMAYHPLGSMLRLMLRLMNVLLRFGFSGRTSRIWPLGLISYGPDSASLLWLLLKTFLGETSVVTGLFDLLQDQHQAAYFSFRVLKI
jgi:hypothetical protein